MVLRNNRLLILIVALILVAGGSSLLELPRMEDPVLRRRVALVNTFMPGADAERIETLISEKIEDELRDIEQIKELRSVSRLGVSTVSIELLDSVIDTDSVWSRVRSRIDDAVPKLPLTASRPTFEELEVRAFALLTALVWQSDEPADWTVLRRLAIDLQDRMQTLPGTDKVERFGDPGEEIEVELDPAAVSSLGLSPSSVIAAIGQFDAKGSAGQLRPDDMQLAVEVGNQFRSADELSSIPIAGNQDVFATLGDVATIRSGATHPLPRSASVDGKPAVVLGAMVRPSYRIDRWSEAADEMLDQYSANLPAGIEVDDLLRQTKYVDQRLSSLLRNLLAGAAAVAVVVWLLMGPRATMLVLIALPLSSLMVLFGLRIFGIPIHQMSITGLIISLGLLIDNAIVIVDEVKVRMTANRRRRHERATHQIDVAGLSPSDLLGESDEALATRSASESIRHLAVPLLGSTITTALAFAPIALMPGPAGEFVGAIAISVILAVFSSLFLAMTVIPALAIRLFPEGKFRGGISIPPLTRLYRNTLRELIGKPWLGISVSIVAPMVGFILAGQLQEQFFPASGRDQFYVTVEGPVTSSVAATKQTAAEVDVVLRRAGAKRIDWFFGESAPQFYYNVIANRRGTRNFGQALVTLNPATDPTATIAAVQADLRDRITDSRVLVRQLEQGPPFEAPIEVRLFGPDLNRIRELGDDVRRRLLAMPDVTYCRADVSEVLPMVSLDVDPSASQLAGISPSRVAEEFRISLDGAIAGSVLQGNEEVPVMVRVKGSSRSELDRIRTMELMPDMTNPPGQSDRSASQREDHVPAAVPLSSIASVNLVPKSAVLLRLNRQRMNEVAGYLNAGVLPSIVQDRLETSLAENPLDLPPGYELRYGGSASKRDDAIGNLLSTAGVLIVLMVATLVLSLGSFQASAIIGAVALMSIGLGLLALIVGGYPFGFMSIIGTMGLIGVAINDSIVVIAALDEAPENNEKLLSRGGIDLVLENTVDRVVDASRHVIATTLTTMAGFAPLILDGGGFWPPMAICIAGGVAGATVLALVFVPAVHFSLVKWGKTKQMRHKSPV